MPTIYQTRDGDVLDAICASYYGEDNIGKTVVQVLEANRDLADRRAVYPAGLFITLPDIAPPVAQSPIQLWD